MPDPSGPSHEPTPQAARDFVPPSEPGRPAPSRTQSSTSLRELAALLNRRRRLALWIEGGLLTACLLYCLIAPNEYEATARVALRTAPVSTLNMDTAGQLAAASILSAPLQQETLADYLRSDRLAWQVIKDLKLYQEEGFNGRFVALFPNFKPEGDAPDARDYLLYRFKRRLHVEALPRSLVLEIGFRTKDARLSAAVVNDIIRVYGAQDSESRMQVTADQSAWIGSQLDELKSRMEADEKRLTAYQTEHGLLTAPEIEANGKPGESEHNSTLLEVDELGRQLVAATSDRILREAEYRSASHGDPEAVITADYRLQAESGTFSTAPFEKIHEEMSNLEVERAQLGAEHGPNFPRVVEIQHELADLDEQKKAEDARLVDRFKSAWQTAADREQLVRKSLDDRTAEGLKRNEAATRYAVMLQEANSSHEVLMRVQAKLDEAGMAAGMQSGGIAVVDYARQPVKPVAPDLLLYPLITFFAGLWIALGVVLIVEAWQQPQARAIALIMALLWVGYAARAQAPLPALDGVPPGVARLPATPDTRIVPDPRESPAVWTGGTTANQAVGPFQGSAMASAPMAAPIGAGDFLDVSESHTPEFHTAVRVSAQGTVTLPMVGEIRVDGLTEGDAALRIDDALLAKGMLLHPQVTALITFSAGRDVSVLGEVARPGVYAYTLHHRLLDLISAASGLSQTSGRLVNVFHRSDPNTPHPVVLDPGGTDTTTDHNPELMPGDTVQVSRAGLVYVIGDVVRPGGFPVDPAQGLTVVQALSLAWGPSENAAAGKALLIREQKGGRTVTTLNLRRMIHGQDPDLPIYDRDILFVPDSMAKNMWNRTMEAAIQSAVGVTIYAGLVYSQRF